jgi:hypothetical protein
VSWAHEQSRFCYHAEGPAQDQTPLRFFGWTSVQPRLDLVSCFQKTKASPCWTSLDKFLKWKSQKQLRSKSI